MLPQQAKWAAILCADCWRQFYVLEKQHALPLRAQLSSARRRAQRTAGTGRLQTARTIKKWGKGGVWTADVPATPSAGLGHKLIYCVGRR